jgi:hypothetical protein
MATGGSATAASTATRLAWSHRCAAVNLKRLLALGLTHNAGWTIPAPA